MPAFGVVDESRGRVRWEETGPRLTGWARSARAHARARRVARGATGAWRAPHPTAASGGDVPPLRPLSRSGLKRMNHLQEFVGELVKRFFLRSHPYVVPYEPVHVGGHQPAGRTFDG